jgi:hypothetical protein
MAQPTPKTLADLAKEAFLELRVVRIDGTPTPEQRAASDRKYTGVYEELAVQGLAFWDSAEIPVSVFLPLARLVAQELAPGLGKEYSAGDAMMRVRIVASKPWSGRTVVAKYY